MAFQCPDCIGDGTLRITGKLELPPDSRSDEITLQVVKCSWCRFEGVAVYEESRRGAFGSESWDHTGFRVAKESLQALKKAIRKCPDQGNHRCKCDTHKQYGATNAGGRWVGLDGMGGRFPMRSS